MNTILTPEKYGELKTRFPRFNEPWSQEETDYLREMAEMNYPQSLMAQDLGRSPNSIRMRLKALGLYTPKPAPKPWKEDDDRRLVAQADGQLIRANTPRDHARDGQRVVGAQHQQATVGVEELERVVVDGAALLERLADLEERGFDREVAMMREALPDGG